jgi:MFS family permease
VIRNTELRALLVAEVVSTTGTMMTWLALPWFVLTTTGSAAQMSFVVAAEAAAYAILGVPSGTLIGRLGARRTMLAADGLRTPVMLLVPVLHWADALSFPLLIGFAALIGALSTPYGAAQRVIVPELLGEDEGAVTQANALFQSATRTTMLLGPPLAGLLIAAVGAPIVLVIDAATFAVAFVLVALFVHPHEAPAPADEDPGFQGMLAGVRYLRSDPLLGLWTIALMAGDAAWNVIFVGTPVLVVAHYGSSPELAGLMFGAFGAGAVLGNALAYRLFAAGIPPRMLAGGVLVQAIPVWALAMPVPAAALLAALAVSGIGNGIVNPTIHSMITLRPPPAVRAKVLSASFTASAIGAPLALVIAGPAFARFDSRAVMAAAAALQLGAMLLLGGSTLARWEPQTGQTAGSAAQ